MSAVLFMGLRLLSINFGKVCKYRPRAIKDLGKFLIKVNSAKIINTNSFSLSVAYFPESTRKGTTFVRIHFSP